jgi:hypothetical protein
LNFSSESLQRKLSEILHWERRKRREQTLATVVAYALLAAVLVLPFHGLLPMGFSRWLIPVPFVLLLAPWLFSAKRWRPMDSVRAVARLDKTLELDERATTAWELLERDDRRGGALLVLKEAGEKLATVNPRILSRRTWSWQARLALPLLILWMGLQWLDFGFQFESTLQPSAPKTMAQKLREFSRELQERAKSEGLRESLQVGRELEKVAEKVIDAKADDEKFKTELSGMKNKIETMGKAAAAQQSLSAAESQQSLKDLKAELEAARDLLNFPEAKGTEGIGQQWLDRLASLPQIKRQLDKENSTGPQGLTPSQLQSFLDQLDRQVTGEFDRRTLLEAQQFLEQMLKQGQGEKGDSEVRVARRGEQDTPADGEKTDDRSNLPGKEPGQKDQSSQSLSEFPAGAKAHVKGLLGEGQSSGVVFKGKPSAGKSEVSQDEVIASYRRQAEAELNTERVPEALKDAIKNYFLSLGIGEGVK